MDDRIAYEAVGVSGVKIRGIRNIDLRAAKQILISIRVLVRFPEPYDLDELLLNVCTANEFCKARIEARGVGHGGKEGTVTTR